ncbi:SART-1 family protein DOT2 [Lycium barbarum]|uniref:SART-1 family protein DOT2 n=1 Tax=Lycium barbarum TaxID=112863 RepID=UPI00293F0034|nr:SART-1 family protein DOT2 [Lycium barbarum]XP_060184697.1 SART-1 family protein DOT2 [Lycium barbarum]
MGMMEIDGRERSAERRDHDDSPVKERWEDGHYDLEESGYDKSKDSSKHRSKDRKSSGRREEKEYKRDRESKELEKDRSSARDRRKEDRDERERDKTREKIREKDSDRDKYKDKERERDKDRRDRGKEKERDRDRERDTERVREKERGKDKGRDKEKDKEKEKERSKDKEREKHRDKEKEKEREYDRERGRDAVEKEKGRERTKEKGKEVDEDKERSRDKDRGSRRQRDEGHDRSKDRRKDDVQRVEDSDSDYQDAAKQETVSHEDEDRAQNNAVETAGSRSELEERILKMKEERLKKKSEGASEVLSWVNKSRKIEEKRNAEKERALQLSKIFEEQDKMNGEESDEEENARLAAKELGGMKVLHGLDKVVEGGAVVLTLKDQSILAGDDINQEVDMLENVEIGEQKRRNDAYKAAKKKTGIYDDKFNDEPGSERKILPKYDDPAEEEGVTLDATGAFSVDAEKKLEELRKRLQGPSSKNLAEDLNSSGKLLSDYYTQEEMVQFKKPKKKKSLRKKEKMDLDALEAEAKSAGLGVGDLGSRNDKTRQVLKEEKERAEAETRSNAYQAAYAKAEEASKALRPEKSTKNQREEDDAVFDDDDEELRKSLERARKLALRKQEGLAKTFPESIASLAASRSNDSTMDNPSSVSGESHENKVVFTEMEEFVWGLQLDEEEQKPGSDDVFMEEDVLPKPSDEEMKNEDGGWTEVKETKEEEPSVKEEEMEVAPDETIREVPVGKGLSGVLKLLQDRGTLKEDIDWGGRNMDKKKSKLVGIRSEDGKKEIHIERTDEYGRILTPKEAFRLLSHKFHGKGPGKMKQEKRMRQYQEELKIKQMNNSDTPSQSVERMKEAQVQFKTPYLVLSGNVKPGQTSDPRSGFATVEKDLPGGLTPMLGDKKVEHFLGIKRKHEPGEGSSQKKPKT